MPTQINQIQKNDEKKELRFFAQEMRAIETDAKEMVIEGYAITFQQPATHYGFTEVIDRSALDETDMSDVPMKYNHEDSYLIIARTRNKSLQLTVDKIGLKIRAVLIDSQSNIDVYKSIQSGLLDKMSFGFSVEAEEWDYETDTRTIKKIGRLYDVSVVDTPFYDDTSIYARSLKSLENGKKGLDNFKLMRAKNKFLGGI